MKNDSKNEENKQYQLNYKPCPYSAEEIKDRLWQYANKPQAIEELERVALNMYHALQNEETPDIVKDHIRNYFFDEMRFDLTENKLVMNVLYVFVCQKVSEIPFIPKRDYIEALTGNDMEKAIETARRAEQEIEFVLYQPISEVEAAELAEKIISNNCELQEIAKLLATLVYAVGNEYHPIRKQDMVDSVVAVCFNQANRYSKKYWKFLRETADYLGREKSNAQTKLNSIKNLKDGGQK